MLAHAHGAGKYGGQGRGARPHSAGLLEVNPTLNRNHTRTHFVCLQPPRDNQSNYSLRVRLTVNGSQFFLYI